jgi:hypothetical protein
MPTVLPNNSYLSVKQYAELNHVTPSCIYIALRDGRLNGYQIGKTWVIAKNAVIQNKRVRDGRMIGYSDLRKNDLEGFLKKRGLRFEE